MLRFSFSRGHLKLKDAVSRWPGLVSSKWKQHALQARMASSTPPMKETTFEPMVNKKPLPNCCSRARPECGDCARYRYMNPECKVAVITEGASGLGFDIANELLCNEAYRVILTGCNWDLGAKALKRLRKKHEEERCCYMKMDPRKESEVKYVLGRISERFNGIDILVNNAKAINETLWESEVTYNLHSVVQGTLVGMELMKNTKARPGGIILNIASTLSFDSDPCLPIFTGTQYAIAGFTKSYGDKKNFAGSDIRVVGLCPGPLNASHLTCNQGLELAFVSNSSIGKAVIHMIQYAPTGTLWVLEEGLYRLKFPERKTFQKKVTYV